MECERLRGNGTKSNIIRTLLGFATALPNLPFFLTEPYCFIIEFNLNNPDLTIVPENKDIFPENQPET